MITVNGSGVGWRLVVPPPPAANIDQATAAPSAAEPPIAEPSTTEPPTAGPSTADREPPR
jgi:hypothetical protein